MEAWYLVYCKPRQERLARSNLERQDFEVYLPLVRARARRRRGKVHARASRTEPMFPRYLFVHLSDQTDDWSPIRSTIGVSSLVRFGDYPARVPDDLIATLRAREDATGVHELPLRPLHAGDRVRILEGVMAGYEAIFHAHTGKDRVMVLLEIAGHAAKTHVSVEDIEPVSAPRATAAPGADSRARGPISSPTSDPRRR